VIARTTVRVAPGGVLAQLSCTPPLTVRRVQADDPDCCALCVVGTAAGPLAGDALELHITVAAGASATLTAAGATLAQGRPGGQSSRVLTDVSVEPGGRLDAHPGAVVVCAGSTVDVDMSISLGAGSALAWRELVVLGRSGEAPGCLRLRWDVVRDGAPLLRQRVDLTRPRQAGWVGMTDGVRVLATALLVGDDVGARTVVASATAVAAPLAPDAALLTVLDHDAARAQRRLAALERELVSVPLLPATMAAR